MKLKLILITIFILVCLYPATAENIQAGFLTGINFANMSVNIDGKWRRTAPITVFEAGFVIDIPLLYTDHSTFYLHLEPMYLQRGVESERLVPYTETNSIINSSYLEFPLLVKMEFERIPHPYFLLGPSFGYLLKSDIEVEYMDEILTGNMKDVSRDFEYGIDLGFGLRYPLTNASLFLEVKYFTPLGQVNESGTMELKTGSEIVEVDFDSDREEFSNKGFQLLAGITFPLGK